MMYKQALLVAVMATWAMADLTCRNYVSEHWKNHKAKVQFQEIGDPGYPPSQYPGLPTNASVGNPWKIVSQSSSGAIFDLKTCNSSSLGLSPFTVGNGCDDGGCSSWFYDYIQIINPSTGHCLTIRDWNSSVSELYFTKCGTNNTNTSQLWLASQEVDYHYDYKRVKGWSNVFLDIVQIGDFDSARPTPFFDWSISRTDNRTLQVVIRDDYRDAGIGTSLFQVK